MQATATTPADRQRVCLPAMDAACEAETTLKRLLSSIDDVTAGLQVRGIETSGMDRADDLGRKALTLVYEIQRIIKVAAGVSK
jgi:hypothetical protein